MSEFKASRSRRDFLRTATVSAGGAAALLSGFGIDPALAAAVGRSEKPLRAAFSNAGLQATWCAQGKQAAEHWGKLFNVEVTWFDGQLDAVKQRAAIDNMASQKWDFVAIQAFGIGTLTAPVQKMIDAGTPVIDMDTLIAPLDQIKVHTLPRSRQRVHGRVRHSGPRHRHGRQGQDHHDPGRARPYRGPRAGPGLRIGHQAIPERRSARHDAGRLGRHQGGADLGNASHQVSADRRRVLPQRRHGARRLQRHEEPATAPIS